MVKLKSLPKIDRPREKLIAEGPAGGKKLVRIDISFKVGYAEIYNSFLLEYGR
jgi:hypothetical protein